MTEDETKREMLRHKLVQRLTQEAAMRLMDRWNEHGNDNPPDMAVQGYPDGEDYKFTLGYRGHEFKVTVSW